jgi:hypothetical protein
LGINSVPTHHWAWILFLTRVGGRRTLKNSQYSWGFAVFRDALAFSFAAEQKIFFITMSHIFLLDILVEFRTTLQKSSWVIQQQLYMVSVYLFIS